MEITQNNGVVTIRLDLRRGNQQKFYLFSDVHFDSVYCNRSLYFSHLKRALEENAFIFDAGDFFDAMQGRFDPRRSMSDLRPEYRREDYYDFVVQDAAEFLCDHAKNIAMMSMGNHELSVLKNANTYLTDRLVTELRKYGSKAVTGGFKGWIRILWRYDRGNDGGSFFIRYSHSGGGGRAPVTRGVIDSNRQAVYLPDANMVWNGHNHHGWVVPIARERVNRFGNVNLDMVWFVRTPGYKAEYEKNDYGFEAQQASGPRPRGCIVVTLEYAKQSYLSARVEPMFEV